MLQYEIDIRVSGSPFVFEVFGEGVSGVAP